MSRHETLKAQYESCLGACGIAQAAIRLINGFDFGALLLEYTLANLAFFLASWR